MSEPATPVTAPPEGTPEAAQPAETDWKAEARKWEQRAKDNKAKLDEAAPIVEQWQRLEEASKTELERSREELTRWQTEAETWRGQAVSSRIQALAADFADPTDAVAALGGDTSKYLDVGGQIKDDAIRTDLAAVLEAKPHWRRQSDAPPAPRIPAPNPHQGSGGGQPSADPATEFAAILQAQLNRA